VWLSSKSLTAIALAGRGTSAVCSERLLIATQIIYKTRDCCTRRLPFELARRKLNLPGMNPRIFGEMCIKPAVRHEAWPRVMGALGNSTSVARSRVR
jgi:hypothetical protein